MGALGLENRTLDRERLLDPTDILGSDLVDARDEDDTRRLD